MFRNLFKVIKYSDHGSNARTKEEQTYMYFIDFLEECETGMHIVTFIYIYIYVLQEHLLMYVHSLGLD